MYEHVNAYCLDIEPAVDHKYFLYHYVRYLSFQYGEFESMSVVDPDLRSVLPLTGTSLAIVITAIICGSLSIPVVTLRTILRFKDDLFGWDDGLMLGGMVTTLN